MLITLRNCLIVLIVLLGGWLAIPPRMIIDPQQVYIDGYTVHLYRTFPTADVLGAPYVRYTEVVRNIDNADTGATAADKTLPNICSDRSSVFKYSGTHTSVGRWNIESWAAPCMYGDYIWETTWIPYIFGILPIRPVTLRYMHFTEDTEAPQEN